MKYVRIQVDVPEFLKKKIDYQWRVLRIGSPSVVVTKALTEYFDYEKMVDDLAGEKND